MKELSLGARSEMLTRILDQYTTSVEAALPLEDVKIIEMTLRNLAKTGSVAIRRVLARRLKEIGRLPEDIALILANDSPDIALPMLEYSPAISDAALLDIIHSSKKNDRLLAIARRSNLSEPITSALIGKKKEAINTAVLCSFGSAISERSYSSMLDGEKVSKKLLQAMVENGSLPFAVMEKLLRKMTEKTRQSLDDEYTVVFESKQLKAELEKNKAIDAAKLLKLRVVDLYENNADDHRDES